MYHEKMTSRRDLAEARLEADAIDIVDGRIVCTNKSAITNYMAECVVAEEAAE